MMTTQTTTPRTKPAREVERAVGAVVAARMPPGWIAELSVDGGRGNAALAVRAPDGTRVSLPVLVRATVEPRDADTLVDDATARATDREAGGALVAARFLTPRTRRELSDRGLNYADLTGNVRLVLARPGLFVEAVGADRDPAPSDRPLRSLKGAAAARVVRALFDATPPIKLGDIAQAAGVSAAQTGRVAELLNQEGVLEQDPRRAVTRVDRTRLIERWVEDYAFFNTNLTGLYVEPRSFDKLLDRLRESGLRYAVTGSLAADQLAPYAASKLAQIYVDDLDLAADVLKLPAVPGDGGNVVLAEPFDDVVFTGVWERDGITYAAPGQVAADLLTSPGRGPAEGEELLRQLTIADRG